MGFRILRPDKKDMKMLTEQEQLDQLMLETQRWQEFHRNEDLETQKEFIEKYRLVKQRLSKMVTPGETMQAAAETANLNIRRKDKIKNPTASHVNVDIATLLEILDGEK